jgi:peptide/nickel transport system substrate-binding protein
MDTNLDPEQLCPIIPDFSRADSERKLVLVPYRLSELSRRDLLIRGGQGGAAVFGLSALLAACGGSSSGSSSSSSSVSSSASSASGTPKKGGDLVFARSVAPTTLDPANTIIAGDIYTLNQIFEPLFITNPNGTLAPWLAKSFTTSSNHLTWTFNLRPGVKFSDGKALTADDVVFSIKREAANSDGPLSFLDFAIKSVTAKGSSTVVVKLSAPWAPFESDMSVFANAILPANFGGKSEKAFFESPVGTGPFTLASWTPDSNLTLKANPGYWQPGKPYVDSVTINYVTDDNQRVLQVTSGQAQIADSVPPANVSQLKSNSAVTVSLFPAWQVDLLVFNEQVAYFKDVHVRRAITYAINRPGLVQAASFGTARPGGSFFPPSLEFYDATTPALAYSVTNAKAELAKSAYPHGFSTKLLVSAGDQTYAEFAQIIQSDLAKIGIKVSITTLDHAAFETTFQKYDYDMFIDYAINDISDPDEMASFETDYKSGGSKSYWSSYDNPKVIALVHQAEAEFDPTKRKALYAQIQSLVAQDAPFVALDYPPYIYATSKKLNGFAVNPGGAYRLADVWLD